MKIRQQGVALLVVLWACTLLAILVGGFASIARVEALQTRFTLGQQRARYAAEAGIMRGIATIDARRRQAVLAEMSDVPPSGAGLPGDGRSLAFDFDGMHVAVGIQDENGKVDINSADSRTLQALFIAAGCADSRATALRRRVEASRGMVGAPVADDGTSATPRLASQEPPNTPARRPVPFAAVEELQALPGMDPALYGRIEPAITIWSGRQTPQPEFAPLLAMATLRGLDLESARAVIAARDGAPPGTPLQNLPGGLALGDALPGRAITFRALADDGHGSRSLVEATVLFAVAVPERDPRQSLYTIVRWRDGPPG